MSNFSKGCDIKCPFYINAKDGKNYITCEGSNGARYYTSRFSKCSDRNQFIANNCAEYPNMCPICHVLEKVYAEEK